MILISTISNAQWKTKTIDNGFDPKYTIAWNESSLGFLLKIENIDGDAVLYVNVEALLDEDVTDIYTEMVFKVNNEWVKFNGACKVLDGLIILSEPMSGMPSLLQAFKASTLAKIRFDYLGDTYTLEWNMSGSTAAYNAVK
jgi:hypothetical protein